MFEDTKINCSIFQKQEPVIEEITAKINGVKGVLEKADFAEELLQEVNILLSCTDYKQQSTDCSNCRFIANMRKKAADIIIKAKKLA
jgi:hypothetical protein